MAQPEGLGERIATGATWMIFQRIAVRAIGLVSTIILARILVPEDFGLVALAASLVAVLDTLLELGFDLALIQKQSDDRSQYDTAWTLSVIRGVLIGAGLLVAARPIAALYEDHRLIQVMAWLAVSAVISGFHNIGCVEFRKELQFDREFRLLVWSKVVGFVVTIGLALAWGDYRALVAGIVVSKAVTVNLSYIMHPYRPSLSLKGCVGFLHFSKWLCLNNVAMLLRGRADTFVIGKIAGTGALGFYTVAYEISNLATTELIWPISRVLFPGFAKIASDSARLARGFLESLSVMAFLAAPMAVGIALTAPHIVGIFLGPKWLVIVPLIQILTLYGLLNLTSANSTALYLALGRPDLVLWRNLPSVVVLIPGLIFGAKYYGVVGAAWALVGSAVVNFAVNFWFLRRELNIGITETMATVGRPIFASIVMLIAVGILERYWPVESELIRLIPQAAALATFGALVYFGAVSGLWMMAGKPAGAEQRALSILRGWFEARFPRAGARAPVANSSAR